MRPFTGTGLVAVCAIQSATALCSFAAVCCAGGGYLSGTGVGTLILWKQCGSSEWNILLTHSMRFCAAELAAVWCRPGGKLLLLAADRFRFRPTARQAWVVNA